MAARQYKVARYREHSGMQDTIVIAGGGHAAAQVVDSLRRDGFVGRLVMVCGEPTLPYQRPPLSKNSSAASSTSSACRSAMPRTTRPSTAS
jgi:3-phenylpropionate/trans-cinnamate dioxygenase ferredoxin reductase subunit